VRLSRGVRKEKLKCASFNVGSSKLLLPKISFHNTFFVSVSSSASFTLSNLAPPLLADSSRAEIASSEPLATATRGLSCDDVVFVFAGGKRHDKEVVQRSRRDEKTNMCGEFSKVGMHEALQ